VGLIPEEDMDVAKQDALAQQLAEMNDLLSAMNGNVTYLLEKQKQRDMLMDEMQPILKEVMASATGKLGELEGRGYFGFMREAMRVADRIVESYDEDDVRALGDNVVRIMDTVRAFTQPRMLAIAKDASQAIEKADELEPTGVFGMVRASRDDDVQRGMAVFLGVLRGIGHGVKSLKETAPKQKRARKRKPAPVVADAKRKRKKGKKRRKKDRPVKTPQSDAVMIDGLPFDKGGYLADASLWTKDLAVAIAASQGINKLGKRHWVAVKTARNDYLENEMSPNIRRLTTISDVTTKELYTLFPKAPAMTIARIAGIPKPAGCI
jgi:tRNA 2-thiouridine synthesizing protein E